MARETQAPHAAGDARCDAVVARRGRDRNTDRTAVLYGRADVELHRVRYAAVGEVRTSIQDVAVLARGDVGLPPAAHRHLLRVCSARGLAAHAAAEHRKAALRTDDAPAGLRALLHFEAGVAFDVGRYLALDLDFIALRSALCEEPHAAGCGQSPHQQNTEQRLAARAAALLHGNALERRFLFLDVAVDLGVLCEVRKLGRVFDGNFGVGDGVSDDVVRFEGVVGDLLQQLHAGERPVI